MTVEFSDQNIVLRFLTRLRQFIKEKKDDLISCQWNAFDTRQREIVAFVFGAGIF